MTIVETGRRGVVEIVEDIAKADEGTALLMVEMLAYDALCDEVDRIQPSLDRDVSRLVAKRAQGALEQVAKRYTVAKSDYERAELEDLAEALTSIVTVAKASDDNPQTPWWDARNDDGTFRARGLGAKTMRGIAGGLGLFTGQDQDTKNVVGPALDRIKDGSKYDAARALGNGLQQINHPHARAAGSIARIVGDIGPEAERVFKPGLTRLAYRYRGTERRPNPQYNTATQGIVASALAQNKASNSPLPPDQIRLRAVADAGAGFLWGSNSVPDQKLAELSLKAGKMPPSRGIIFDAEGHPVSESVGFNGDHYLPFDLKNLKRLRGGQFVRSRTTGGLTDEDIYTGLLTGARQVTVISNSGVFSIEFDPSLRGGRRYSDKARQMVDRYASLLATINQGKQNGLFINDLTPREKAQIRSDAFERARGNKALAEQYERDELEKERTKRQYQAKDDEELMDEARAEARQELGRQQRVGEVKGVSERTLAQRTRDLFQEKKAAQRESMVRYYRLDFDGYKAAQDALAQEFPYFIRSKQALRLDEWLQRTNRLRPDDPLPPRPGADIGYTRRNALAPSGVGRTKTEERPSEEKPAATSGFKDALRSETPTAAESAAWHDALSDPARRADLANALEHSLAYRRRITAGMEEPADLNDPDDRALGAGGEGYGLWILHSKKNPNGIAEFLLDPSTDEEHINKTIDAIRAVKPAIRSGGEEYYTEAAANQAIQQLEQIKLLRQPFAEPAAKPVYAQPNAPQPFADILPLVGNQQALNHYAEENEELARQARSFSGKEGDEKAKAAIESDLRQAHLIERWEKDANGLVNEDNPPAGMKYSADEANLWLKDRDNSELHQSLERKQKGWALARAAMVTAAINGTEVQVGPKADLGKSARFKTGSRLVVRKRQPSPSGPLHPSSSSSLATVLAKRLADDPKYLGRLLSDL